MVCGEGSVGGNGAKGGPTSEKGEANEMRRGQVHDSGETNGVWWDKIDAMA